MFEDSEEPREGLPRNLDDSVKKYREVLRKGKADELRHALSHDALETLIQYCLESNKYDDALAFGARLRRGRRFGRLVTAAEKNRRHCQRYNQ